MTRTSASLPLKITAALLLALVAWRSYRLVELQRSENLLGRFPPIGPDVASFVPHFDLLDQAERGRLSPSQAERLEVLRRSISRDALLATAILTWPDGTSLRLGDAITTSVGAPQEGLPRLVINPAAFGRSLATVKIDGKILDASAGSWDLPLAIDTEHPNPRMSLQLGIDEDHRHDFQLNFVRDRNPPQLSFSGKNGRVIDDDGGILGLQPDESLTVEVQDGTLMRRVRINLDAAVVLDRANERIVKQKLFTLEANEAPRKVKLVVEAADWSGNVLSRSFAIRLEEAALPRLVSATLAGQDLLSGPRRCRDAVGEIEFAIEGRPHAGHLEVDIEGQKTLLLEAKGEKSRPRLPFEFTAAGGDRFAARLCVTRYDTRIVLGEIEVIHDGERPHIDLFDAQGAPILVDKVSLQGGGQYRLEVRDNDVLDLGHEVTERQGGVRLEAPKKDKQLFTQAVQVDDSGRLIVVARDLAGNESRREFDFTVTAMLAPDDGEGPKIALLAGGTELDAQENLLFWQDAKDLELRVSDPAGVDLGSLEMERLSLFGTVTSRGESEFHLQVKASGDPTVEVADSHGRKTRASWPIIIVTGPATIGLAEGKTRVEQLPVGFEWRLKDVLPTEALRCALVAPDGSEKNLKTEGGKGKIAAEDCAANGPYRLLLRLLTPNGAVEIASSSFALARD